MSKVNDTPFAGLTPAEWMERADWEGGVIAGLEYGLSEAEINPGEYREFYALVSKAADLNRRLNELVMEIEDYAC